MVVTTLPTTVPPCWATLEAWATSWLAWRAASALWRTVSVSCCMDADVCCRLDAVNSVRPLRSWLPVAISSAATRTELLTSRICASTPESLPAKLLKLSAICASSSWPCAPMRRDRSPSPAPISCMASRTCVSRRSRCDRMPASTTSATSSTTMPAPSETCSMVVMARSASPWSSAMANNQGVSVTGATVSSMARPCRSTAVRSARWAMAASAAAASEGATSVAGLRASFTSGWAMMLPSVPTRNA